MKYNKYLQSEYWHEVSRRVKERADYRCQVCNSPHDLQAHHRTYEHRGYELNHLNDLICLCRKCHATFHGKAEKTKGKKVFKKLPIIVEQRNIPESDIPTADKDGFIVLTKELVHNCRTDVGGFTGMTLKWLGIGPKPESGWVRRLVGKKILLLEYRSALDGRTIRKR